MKKRGQITLKAIIELVIAITVFLLFIYVGKTWGNAEVFQKARVAKETALIINAMYATEGNAYITYPVNISKFSIKFSQDKVQVYKVDPDPTAFTYSFIKVADFTIDKEIKNPDKLILARLGDEIIILDIEPNLNQVKYEEIDTKSTISNKKILLAIDKETINDPKKFIKAKAIIESLKSQFSNIYLTPETLAKGISGTSTNEADILISISIGDYDDQRNIIKAYYPIGGEEKKKRKFASLIINQLLEKELNIDGANAIPTDFFQPSTNTEISVLLEIGNINSDKSLDMFNTKTNDITDGIYNAIKEYYYS